MTPCPAVKNEISGLGIGADYNLLPQPAAFWGLTGI